MKVFPVIKEENELYVVARPYNSQLKKRRLIEASFNLLSTWQDAVRRYLKEAQL